MFLSMLLCPIHQSEAAAWPAIDPIINQALEKITAQIKAMLLGVAKQAALKAVQKQVLSMVGGKSSSGPMFVSDWNDYLVDRPQSASNIYINDYISQATSGRGSLTSYKPAGGEGVGGGSYMSQLAQGAKNTTSGKPTQPKVTYVGNPSQMFASSNGFANLDLYLSGVNNPWTFNMDVQQAYQTKLDNEKMINQSKAVSGQGFIGTEVSGKTVTPGSVVAAQTSKSLGMGLDVLANARDIPELITSAVTMAITQAIQQGLGNVQASVNRSTTNVNSQKSTQNNAAVQSGGPGSLYKR